MAFFLFSNWGRSRKNRNPLLERKPIPYPSNHSQMIVAGAANVTMLCISIHVLGVEHLMPADQLLNKEAQQMLPLEDRCAQRLVRRFGAHRTPADSPEGLIGGLARRPQLEP